MSLRGAYAGWAAPRCLGQLSDSVSCRAYWSFAATFGGLSLQQRRARRSPPRPKQDWTAAQPFDLLGGSRGSPISSAERAVGGN